MLHKATKNLKRFAIYAAIIQIYKYINSICCQLVAQETTNFMNHLQKKIFSQQPKSFVSLTCKFNLGKLSCNYK